MFKQPTVEYLSEGCLEMDLVKVESVWSPIICRVHQLQHFVQDFSHVANPLNQLTQKAEACKWTWTKEEQQTFENVRVFSQREDSHLMKLTTQCVALINGSGGPRGVQMLA